MIWVFTAFFFGGLLKGATGVGAPMIALPLMAVLFDLPFAIAVFSIPNVIGNIWQGWAYRREVLPAAFSLRFALGGLGGAGIGTVMLAYLPSTALELLTALLVFVYIGFRLCRPGWALSYALARRVVLPVGTFAGILQGAAGISAPVSITFLSAMRGTRGAFVGTISAFFTAVSVTQIPLLIHYEILTWERFALGCAALIPLFAAMPLGAMAARRLSPAVFDRIILTVLAIVALRLGADAVL